MPGCTDLLTCYLPKLSDNEYSVMRQKDSWIIPFGMKFDMTCEGEVCLSISFNLELSCSTSFITESMCLITDCQSLLVPNINRNSNNFWVHISLSPPCSSKLIVEQSLHPLWVFNKLSHRTNHVIFLHGRPSPLSV